MRTALATCALLLFIPLSTSGAVAGEPKVHACVTFAATWDAAVQEARLLNVPIVVHNHGFYCPPCWGMHASVLQNKKYIRFAEATTVEVVVLSSLDQGIEKEDPKAAEYETKVDGQTVKYMVEFPGMSRAQMLALGRSQAARYNMTGGVPYTCIVDPYTLEEVHAWRGGQSAKTVMKEIEIRAKALEEAHGKGLSRKDLRKYEEAEAGAGQKAEAGEFATALTLLDAATKQAGAWPEGLKARAQQARAGVVRAASVALDAVEALSREDAKEARRRLSRMKSKLRGTDLDERVRTLLASLAAR